MNEDSGESSSMLVIRGAQVHTLVEPTLQAFEVEALEHVRSEYPDELARRGQEAIEALIERAVVKAWGYRMTRSADVLALLSLMIVLGDGFDRSREHPWMAEILGSRTLHPDEKVAMVLDELLDELLADADPSK